MENKYNKETNQENSANDNNDDQANQNQNTSKDFISEGKVTIRLCNDDKSFSAFYNPAQVKLKFLLKKN